MTLSRAWSLVVFALVSSSTFASKQEKDANALIEHAKHLSDIRADGAPPFLLKVDLKITNDDGSIVDGKYTEYWVSKKQWRKETELGDFRRTEVAAGEKLWILNTANAPTLLGDIASISSVSRLRPEAWKSRKDRDINGVGVHCLENGTNSETWATCFDKATGTLYAELSPSTTDGGRRVCVHSNYQTFGEYTVARSYLCQEGKRQFQATVTDLAIYAKQDPALFVRPEGAKESPHCLGSVKPPIPVRSPPPPTPASFSGTNVVKMMVVVRTDGKPDDLRVISAPNPGYDEAAVKTVREWRFKPATCDGGPMETTMMIQVEFHHY